MEKKRQQGVNKFFLSELVIYFSQAEQQKREDEETPFFTDASSNKGYSQSSSNSIMKNSIMLLLVVVEVEVQIVVLPRVLTTSLDLQKRKWYFKEMKKVVETADVILEVRK